MEQSVAGEAHDEGAARTRVSGVLHRRPREAVRVDPGRRLPRAGLGCPLDRASSRFLGRLQGHGRRWSSTGRRARTWPAEAFRPRGGGMRWQGSSDDRLLRQTIRGPVDVVDRPHAAVEELVVPERDEVQTSALPSRSRPPPAASRPHGRSSSRGAWTPPTRESREAWLVVPFHRRVRPGQVDEHDRRRKQRQARAEAARRASPRRMAARLSTARSCRGVNHAAHHQAPRAEAARMRSRRRAAADERV